MCWNSLRWAGLKEDVVRAADNLVSMGLAAAGDKYVVVVDCGWAYTRGADRALQANADRFLSGVKGLANYVHSRGLKFGSYGWPGSRTCAMIYDRWAGKALRSLGHEQQDANSWAVGGADFIKYDWCLADGDEPSEPPAFTMTRDALAKTALAMVYSVP